MSNPDHSDNIKALKRVEGQIRGIQKMIEERKYCPEILIQISAIKGALGRIEMNILKRHFEHCVTDSMKSTNVDDKKAKLDEIFKIIERVKRG